MIPSRCRAFFALVLSLIGFVTMASAAAPMKTKVWGKHPMPEIMSYYQLQELNGPEREKYIRGVISLLHNLENREKPLIEPIAKKKTASYDVWGTLLRGEEALAAAACGAEYNSIPDGKYTYCVNKCKPGTNQISFACHMVGRSDGLVYCKADCVGVARKPGWLARLFGYGEEEKPTVTDQRIDKGDKDRALPSRDGKPTEIAPGDADSTSKADPDNSVKDQPKRDPCYEIACPAEDSKYRFTVKEDFNKRVSGRKDTRCINAGMIGKYSIDTIKKCMSVREYKIGESNLTCANGTTMCNPLLFGLEKNDPMKPHCIPIGIEMTQQCYNKADGYKGAEDFWKNPKLSHEEMAAKWKELTDHLSKDLCTEEASAKYHCLECALIAKRIAELNKMVDKCPDGNKCGEKVVCASRWESVKPLEAEDTKGTR